jgi:hypothetical protein
LLPILESNKYNLIRVMMEFKGVNHYKELSPQQITTPARTGFVAVEWGGTQL